MSSRKIQENSLCRIRRRLEEIRQGKATFRKYFGFEHRDWREITEYLIGKVREEDMRNLYEDICYGPYPPCPVPTFDDWLEEILTRNNAKKSEQEVQK